MVKALLAFVALSTAAGSLAQRPGSPSPRLDVKGAETRAFSGYGEPYEVRERGAPCLVEKATGRRVCKTMPQWRKLAARMAAEPGTNAPR